jgi:hypothetical protein
MEGVLAVKRIPIKVNRFPIKLPQEVRLHMKRQQLQEETREDDILAIAEHYNMCARKYKGSPGYNSLSLTNPKKHRNWKHFELVYEACRMQEWDTKLYIEAQFQRSKELDRMLYPGQMYSVNAFRYFTNYLSDIRQKHAKDTNKRTKEKGRETLTVRDEVVKGIQKSVQLLSEALKHTKIEDGAQSKILKIFHSWAELSPYYLWSIPWFHEALKEFPSDAVDVQRVTKQFGMISGSKSVQNLIEETVSETERKLNIPKNMEL